MEKTLLPGTKNQGLLGQLVASSEVGLRIPDPHSCRSQGHSTPLFRHTGHPGQVWALLKRTKTCKNRGGWEKGLDSRVPEFTFLHPTPWGLPEPPVHTAP
jgi:hypothetical protein